jgi:hypothetical protein
MTSGFVVPAKTMARIGGIPEYPFLVTPHPTGSLPLEAVKARARELAPRAMGLLLKAEVLSGSR